MIKNNPFQSKTAVIIGASITGLLMAKVMSQFFKKVILLDRHSADSAGQASKGVPQGRHAHGLLVKGLDIIEDYFPEITKELINMGADYGDISSTARWFNNGNFHHHSVAGFNSLNISRPILESTIRAKVKMITNVEFRLGCQVTSLLSGEDGCRITGVEYHTDSDEQSQEKLTAYMVVDASGRSSRSGNWLKKLGLSAAKKEEVKIKVSYTTCEFKREPEHLPGLKSLSIAVTPPNRSGGVMLSQEGGRWMVTIGEYLNDRPLKNHQEFIEKVKAFPTQEIYNLICNAEPISKLQYYKVPSNLRRRYENLQHFPEGYLVAGDAICSFNPIYAQGMTVAAMESCALSSCLSQGETDLARRFFSNVSKILDVPWNIAVGNDLRFPEIEGKRTNKIKLVNWYMSKLHRAAHHDPIVSIAFLKVINLIEQPQSVMRLSILWRVFKHHVRQINPTQ